MVLCENAAGALYIVNKPWRVTRLFDLYPFELWCTVQTLPSGDFELYITNWIVAVSQLFAWIVRIRTHFIVCDSAVHTAYTTELCRFSVPTPDKGESEYVCPSQRYGRPIARDNFVSFNYFSLTVTNYHMWLTARLFHFVVLTLLSLEFELNLFITLTVYCLIVIFNVLIRRDVGIVKNKHKPNLLEPETLQKPGFEQNTLGLATHTDSYKPVYWSTGTYRV